jgi:adenylate kinase
VYLIEEIDCAVQQMLWAKQDENAARRAGDSQNQQQYHAWHNEDYSELKRLNRMYAIVSAVHDAPAVLAS